MAPERRKLLQAREAWANYEEWRRARPSAALGDVEEAFARNEELLALARRLGSVEEPSLEEKARAAQTMRRALAALSS